MMTEERFVQEVMQMRDMLYRLSVSYLHHDHDAQDAVSQAIENAWRHRDRVSPDAFRPWLTRIVINQCKTLLRQRGAFSPAKTWSAMRAWPNLWISRFAMRWRAYRTN